MHGGEYEGCRIKREGIFQRAAIRSTSMGDVPPIVRDVLRSPGQPLDVITRALMEPRFGHDFSQVRVHTDAKAAESARAVNALAYTVGRDIVFGQGRHEPETTAGRRLMAHELAHVMQQPGTPRGARIEATSSSHDNYEREAMRVASTIVTDQLLHVAHRRSQFTLSRAEPSEVEIPASNGCRKVTETACPGTRGQFTRIEWFPKMFLVNRGTCQLFIAGLTADDRVINPQEAHFQLQPGESGIFEPPKGSASVGFGCTIGCEGTGRLEHPYLCA